MCDLNLVAKIYQACAGKQNVMLFSHWYKKFHNKPCACSVSILSIQVKHATPTPMRKLKRQGSCESSDRGDILLALKMRFR